VCMTVNEYSNLKMFTVFSGLPAQYDSGETSNRDSRCKGDKWYPSRLRMGVSLCTRAMCGRLAMSATGRGLIQV
jgi:hypothetical protein